MKKLIILSLLIVGITPIAADNCTTLTGNFFDDCNYCTCYKGKLTCQCPGNGTGIGSTKVIKLKTREQANGYSNFTKEVQYSLPSIIQPQGGTLTNFIFYNKKTKKLERNGNKTFKETSPRYLISGFWGGNTQNCGSYKQNKHWILECNCRSRNGGQWHNKRIKTDPNKTVTIINKNGKLFQSGTINKKYLTKKNNFANGK